MKRLNPIIIGVVILVGLGGIFAWKVFSPSKLKPLPQEKPISTALTPEQVTENFYRWYIDCQERKQEECTWEKSEYVSEQLIKATESVRGYDPILCAQDVPKKFTIGNAEIVGDYAVVPVTEEFYEPQTLKVELGLINNQWKITNVICYLPYSNEKYKFEIKYPSIYSEINESPEEEGPIVAFYSLLAPEISLKIYLDQTNYKSFQDYKNYRTDIKEIIKGDCSGCSDEEMERRAREAEGHYWFKEETIGGVPAVLHWRETYTIGETYEMFVWLGNGRILRFTAGGNISILDSTYHSFKLL